MNGKYRILFLIIIIIIIWKSFHYFNVISQEQETFNDTELDIAKAKTKVSVYYEALCPDSKFFITYQLRPVYEELEDFITLDLVPYGKATTIEANGKYIFNCQHEAVECLANKIHACVINLVSDPLQQIKYIACMITDNMIPEDAGEKCGQELNIDYTQIGECANEDKGSNLLKHYGDRTHVLSPPVKFIPTIEINDSQNFIPQSAILKDLKKSLCQTFKIKPKKCGGW